MIRFNGPRLNKCERYCHGARAHEKAQIFSLAHSS